MSRQSPLIVTNGDSGASAIRAAGIEHEILTWDDVLHDGPVPKTDRTDELRQRRAAFLAKCGWAEAEEALSHLRSRDEALQNAVETGQPIVIWVEHDLYDQLQRLQIITQAADGDLWEIPMDCYVAETDPSVLAEAWNRRAPLSSQDRQWAREAWMFFRQPDPTWLVEFINDVDTGRQLNNAVRRWIESFPDLEAGLNRTERFLLEALREAPRTGAWLFQASQEIEEARFRGDASFHLVLSGLKGLIARGDSGALDARDVFRAELKLSSRGMDVIEGRADRVDTCGLAEWRGGCFLVTDRHWRQTQDGRLEIRTSDEQK